MKPFYEQIKWWWW